MIYYICKFHIMKKIYILILNKSPELEVHLHVYIYTYFTFDYNSLNCNEILFNRKYNNINNVLQKCRFN